MRRFVGLVLIGLGVALIVLAIALPTYVYPRVADIPADPDTTLSGQGLGMTVLLPRGQAEGGPRILTNQRVDVTRQINGEIRPQARRPGDGEAFYRVAVRVEVQGQGLLNAYVEGASFDVLTGETTNCCGDYLKTSADDTEGTPIEHRGLLFKFPFNTEREDYAFWDVNIRAPETARFDGTERLEGLLTYRFVQTVDEEVIGRQEVPGALLGVTAPSVTADRVYVAVRTLWVEPYTGALIKGSERLDQRLVAQDKQIPVLVGTITSTDATVRANVERYRDSARGLRFLSDVGPILGWILGPLLLLIGIGLALSGQRPGDQGPGGDEPSSVEESQRQQA